MYVYIYNIIIYIYVYARTHAALFLESYNRNCQTPGEKKIKNLWLEPATAEPVSNPDITDIIKILNPYRCLLRMLLCDDRVATVVRPKNKWPNLAIIGAVLDPPKNSSLYQ